MTLLTYKAKYYIFHRQLRINTDLCHEQGWRLRYFGGEHLSNTHKYVQLTYNSVNGTFMYYGINAHKEPLARSLTVRCCLIGKIIKG